MSGTASSTSSKVSESMRPSGRSRNRKRRLVSAMPRPYTAAEDQLELEGGVGLVEGRPEQLAQAAEAVANGLGMQVQLGGRARDAAVVAQPGQQRLGQTRTRARGLGGQRREP